MIEPGATDPRENLRTDHRPDPVRDERSMMLVEFLVSITAFVAAALLAIAR